MGQEASDGANDEVVDVTLALQALVHSSQLTIPGGRSKSGLMGFWDPCIGMSKRLSVRYTFKGRPHLAVIDDHAPLLLPLRGELRIAQVEGRPELNRWMLSVGHVQEQVV